MLIIGIEKIYTQTELLERLRTFPLEILDPACRDMVVRALAVALDESREFVEGVLSRKSRREER
jgi:hypothetical protein